MWIVLIGAILLLSCGACAAQRYYITSASYHTFGYSIDGAFSASEVADIDSGVKAWVEASHGHLEMHEDLAIYSYFHFMKRAEGTMGRSKDDSRVIVGEYHYDTGIVNVVPGPRTRAIVIHELGHAWRLDHNDWDRDSFMQSDITNVSAPFGPVMEVDIKVACGVLGC